MCHDSQSWSETIWSSCRCHLSPPLLFQLVSFPAAWPPPWLCVCLSACSTLPIHRARSPQRRHLETSGRQHVEISIFFFNILISISKQTFLFKMRDFPALGTTPKEQLLTSWLSLLWPEPNIRLYSKSSELLKSDFSKLWLSKTSRVWRTLPIVNPGHGWQKLYHTLTLTHTHKK